MADTVRGILKTSYREKLFPTGFSVAGAREMEAITEFDEDAAISFSDGGTDL